MKVYATPGTITHTVFDSPIGGLTVIADDGVATGLYRNPLCVLVPCHRVVGRDGKLTGYAGGPRRKRFLLDLEDWGQLW